MSADDFEAQRDMNQRVVRAQRQVLVLDRPRDKWVAAGVARVTLYLDQFVCDDCKATTGPKEAGEGCGHEPDDKTKRKMVALAKKELRKDAQSKGYLVAQVTTHRLLNGNVEVRGLLQKKVSAH